MIIFPEFAADASVNVRERVSQMGPDVKKFADGNLLTTIVLRAVSDKHPMAEVETRLTKYVPALL